MNTINIKLYDILKKDFHLSDEKAKNFAIAINEVVTENTENKDFKSAIKEDLLRLELKLTNEITTSKNDMLKWFIGLFITLALMIVGLYIKK